MGAAYEIFQCRGETDADVVEQVRAHMEDCAYMHGHDGYSGSFAECSGVDLTNKTFNTTSDADDWIIDEAYKRGPAIGVKIVPDNDKIKPFHHFGAWCAE